MVEWHLTKSIGTWGSRKFKVWSDEYNETGVRRLDLSTVDQKEFGIIPNCFIRSEKWTFFINTFY